MVLAERLAAVDGVRVISPTDDDGRSGNVCVVVDGWPLAELAARLEDECGVLCAARGPSLRFSPHFYTGTESLDRATAALAALVHGT
jgi:cysteine desulfurase / selenocysteine lyase